MLKIKFLKKILKKINFPNVFIYIFDNAHVFFSPLKPPSLSSFSTLSFFIFETSFQNKLKSETEENFHQRKTFKSVKK